MRPTPAAAPGFNRLKACRHGMMLYNVNDAYVGRSLELYGEFSELETALLRQLVRPGDVVADVGANIGAHTVFLAQAVGPTGAVLAFEPQRVCYQTLCANLALSSITNAHCWNVALGEAPGTLRVPPVNYGQANNFGGLSLSADNAGETVSVLRLDDLPVQKLSLLKIDVEGMELSVLKGAAQTIARLRPLLYVENDRPERSAGLIAHLDAAGYAMYWHRPPLFNPDNFGGNGENVFQNIVSINMLCVPRERYQHVSGLQPVHRTAAA